MLFNEKFLFLSMECASHFSGSGRNTEFLNLAHYGFSSSIFRQIVLSVHNLFFLFSKTFSKMKRTFAVRKTVTASVLNMCAKDTLYVIALGYKQPSLIQCLGICQGGGSSRFKISICFGNCSCKNTLKGKKPERKTLVHNDIATASCSYSCYYYQKRILAYTQNAIYNIENQVSQISNKI